ncbi:hypothetical protein [Streptomyces iconiensis]|uniref:CDP-Glycerol:Poly(Glycerophosphate) glycerophosphotransferase n=1 Tax=Streptomyces iconiensis TaxID=1384038 RepID=A0ABT7A121_9ACTN|nr:hypothetical protein [Streptomyces iconiensis]MDJ1135014.1 hypothetical protein [Streptomyces iconiensis]
MSAAGETAVSPTESALLTESALVQRGEWVTVPGCRSVLVVVHTTAYAQRLWDVFTLLESDMRVQVVFTVAPHAFGEGVERYLAGLGATVVPWERAVATEFDVALAAGSRGVERLRAPLVRLPHGAAHNKPLRTPDGASPPGTPGMLSRRHLMRDGRVVPAALVLAHERDRRALAESCPEALPVARVAGDPCHDRIVAALPQRAAYRRALGLKDGERLLVVTSTWGPSSAFGRFESLLPRLLAELPRGGGRFRVLVLMHPNVWAGHGGWQVRGWLGACRRAGIVLAPPEADWMGPLLAADHVIGDHGSLTAYSTLTGAPILLTHCAARRTAPGSPAALLAARAPVLSPLHPLREQLEYARERRPAWEFADVAGLLTSEPGRFHRRMRTVLYGVLGIGEPAYPPAVPPVPLPPPLESWAEGAPAAGGTLFGATSQAGAAARAGAASPAEAASPAGAVPSAGTPSSTGAPWPAGAARHAGPASQFP